MSRYEKRLYKKANRTMRDCEMSSTEYKVIMDYIEGQYAKDKKGFISYLKYTYMNNCYITINEYYNLCSLA